jgi:hypothetical protein
MSHGRIKARSFPSQTTVSAFGCRPGTSGRLDKSGEQSIICTIFHSEITTINVLITTLTGIVGLGAAVTFSADAYNEAAQKAAEKAVPMMARKMSEDSLTNRYAKGVPLRACADVPGMYLNGLNEGYSLKEAEDVEPDPRGRYLNCTVTFNNGVVEMSETVRIYRN